MRLIRSRAALWTAFLLVHGWLTYLGVGPARGRSFGDVDLYRRWALSGLHNGFWPGLDSAWVYPVGAWVPILIPAVVSVTSKVAYALSWCIVVALLDALVVQALDRTGRAPSAPGPGASHVALIADDPSMSGRIAAWGWVAFVAALGPVAIGRLDSIVAPMMVIALLAARRHPGVASALLTAGAWIKVAPGALLIAVAAAAKRPVRDVVLPAAAVSAVVVGVTAAFGGMSFLAGFLGDQDVRGLQVEAVGATPWVLAGMFSHQIHIIYNVRLVTFEITGPGTATVAGYLNALLVLVVAGVSVLVVWARRRGVDVLLPGALALAATLIVTNKVGSPQYMMWLAPAIAVAVATRAHGPWLRLGVLALGTAAATQIIYPWSYGRLLRSEFFISSLLALRNIAVVVMLVVAINAVVQTIRERPTA